MTARRTWKKRESNVANFFQGQRTPLSGGNSKITRSDVIHEDLFIECKLKKKHTVITLWDETKKHRRFDLGTNSYCKRHTTKSHCLWECEGAHDGLCPRPFE